VGKGSTRSLIERGLVGPESAGNFIAIGERETGKDSCT